MMRTGSEQYMDAITMAQGYINVDMLLTAEECLYKARDICHDLNVNASIVNYCDGTE